MYSTVRYALAYAVRLRGSGAAHMDIAARTTFCVSHSHSQRSDAQNKSKNKVNRTLCGGEYCVYTATQLTYNVPYRTDCTSDRTHHPSKYLKQISCSGHQHCTCHNTASQHASRGEQPSNHQERAQTPLFRSEHQVIYQCIPESHMSRFPKLITLTSTRQNLKSPCGRFEEEPVAK